MEHSDKPITVRPRGAGRSDYTLVGGTPWTIPNIGTPIDNMAGAYQRYINRKNALDGKAAIKDFQAAARDFLDKAPKLYEYLYSHLPIAAPPINRGMRERIDITTEWNQFHARWLTLMQICQHWSVREELMTMEKKVQKIEWVYEMHRTCSELLQLSEGVPLEPEKGLNQ